VKYFLTKKTMILIQQDGKINQSEIKTWSSPNPRWYPRVDHRYCVHIGHIDPQLFESSAFIINTSCVLTLFRHDCLEQESKPCPCQHHKPCVRVHGSCISISGSRALCPLSDIPKRSLARAQYVAGRNLSESFGYTELGREV
jgi:hypothetical protein